MPGDAGAGAGAVGAHASGPEASGGSRQAVGLLCSAGEGEVVKLAGRFPSLVEAAGGGEEARGYGPWAI